MAIRLTLTYLRRALNVPLPGKIEVHFSSCSKRGRSGWHMSEAESAEMLQCLKEVKVADVHKIQTTERTILAMTKIGMLMRKRTTGLISTTWRI
jgi:hypothetical protein